MKPYILTHSGRKFWYNNISKDSVYIPDIIHAIVRLNRFTGHAFRRYNVGEHTFLGLVMAEKLGYTALERFLWFIHDFTEAYCNDIPAPLKPLLPQYVALEAEVEKAILDYHGLPELTDEQFSKVKRIDMTMLVLEMRDLTHHSLEEFIDERTYMEILQDDDFHIGMKPLDDEVLTGVLTRLYNDLVKELGLSCEICELEN
jgi:hypothetical protein